MKMEYIVKIYILDPKLFQFRNMHNPIKEDFKILFKTKN